MKANAIQEKLTAWAGVLGSTATLAAVVGMLLLSLTTLAIILFLIGKAAWLAVGTASFEECLMVAGPQVDMFRGFCANTKPPGGVAGIDALRAPLSVLTGRVLMIYRNRHPTKPTARPLKWGNDLHYTSKKFTFFILPIIRIRGNKGDQERCQKTTNLIFCFA
jgi:hypothetical protein